jgi:hypothetical protein
MLGLVRVLVGVGASSKFTTLGRPLETRPVEQPVFADECAVGVLMAHDYRLSASPLLRAAS